MSKVKIKRKSTRQDLAPMSDVGFLLLTFFILTATFTKQEALQVSIPSSVSDIKIPETNIMTVLVDKTGKVYFGIDGQEKRRQLIEKMAGIYKVNLSPEEMKKYTLLELTGNPMQAMKAFLNLPAESRDLPQNNLGIPADTTNNEFKDWVKSAREVNPELRIAIKADEKTPYPVIKKVMRSLQQLDESRYNLITKLEGAPGRE